MTLAISTRASGAGKTIRISLIVAIAVAVVGASLWFFNPFGGKSTVKLSGQYVTIAKMNMELRIVRDGELQAVEFQDIKSQVEGSTSVLELVREGSTVKKGDVMCILDSSQLVQRKEDLENQLIKAKSAFEISKQIKEIQESQNATSKEAGEVNVQLAEIQLKEYLEGTFPQQLQNAKTQLEMANITLKNRQEDFQQTQALNERGFVTAADVKKGEVDVLNSKNEVAKATTALKVLQEYSYTVQTTQLKSTLAQAKQRLARTLKENESMLMQKTSDMNEKEQTLKDLTKRLNRVNEQIEACTIKAPIDGLVLYASSVDNQREPLQDGSTVRQSQWLFRLPNIDKMKAVVNLNESQKVQVDKAGKEFRALVNIIGYPKPIGATLTNISPLPDNRMRYMNPDRRDYPCDLTLDETPKGLKPGAKVDRAEIFIDTIPDTIAIPLACIYTVGGNSWVFVKNGDYVKERKVSTGVANDSHVQIVSGLEVAEQVLMLEAGQGRLLLQELGIKVEEPTSRPAGRRIGPGPAPAGNGGAPTNFGTTGGTGGGGGGGPRGGGGGGRGGGGGGV